jgi:hypothetical protein
MPEMPETRDKLEFPRTRAEVAGQDVRVTAVLPWKLHALLPDAIDFAFPQDWYIISIEIGGRMQWFAPIAADEVIGRMRRREIRLDTIQRRMEVLIVARAQKHDLEFACEIFGVSVRSTSVADQLADEGPK